MIISRSVPVAAKGSISFLLWLSNILLHCICAVSSLSVHLLVDISVAAMSWLLCTVLLWTSGCVYLFKLEFLSFLDICSGSGIAGSYTTVWLVFEGTSVLVSKLATPIYIATNSVGWKDIISFCRLLEGETGHFSKDQWRLLLWSSAVFTRVQLRVSWPL